MLSLANINTLYFRLYIRLAKLSMNNTRIPTGGKSTSSVISNTLAAAFLGTEARFIGDDHEDRIERVNAGNSVVMFMVPM